MKAAVGYNGTILTKLGTIAMGLKQLPDRFVDETARRQPSLQLKERAIERCMGPHVLRQQQLIEQCFRDDLPPLDMAKAMRDLMILNGWSGRKLALELGYN